jgi:uncharacterized membrane protein
MSTHRPDMAPDIPAAGIAGHASRLSEPDALRGFAAVAVRLFHPTALADRQGLAPFRLDAAITAWNFSSSSAAWSAS